MGSNTIAIIPTAPIAHRNRDIEYPFRADSDFYYLTGFEEPQAVAVIVPKRKKGEFVLFCRERDPLMETWNGPRAGLEGAKSAYGADEAYPIDKIDEYLPALLQGCQKVYYTLGCHKEFDQQVINWVQQLREKIRSGVQTPDQFNTLDHLVHEMRLTKSRSEIVLMRRAAKISAQAHINAMRACKPGCYEYQVEAEIKYHFHKHGCTESYPSIVGGGTNSCILHYVENNQELKDGDMLLIDAGCEHQYYAADITRSFPVNGKFSKEQKAIYDIVLKAQLAAIGAVKPGNHWNQPHEAAVREITKGLVKLGLLKGTPAELIKKEAYKTFYMHRTGHWLGMDVHDVGEYKSGERWRKLEQGMALTIEPGIYIAPGTKRVPKKWWGIGIRIEDDVVVTKGGCEVLTKDVPKTVTEIEALMAG